MRALEPCEKLFVLKKLKTRFPFKERDFIEAGFTPITNGSDNEPLEKNVLVRMIVELAYGELSNIVSDAMSFVCTSHKESFSKESVTKKRYFLSLIIETKYCYIERLPIAHKGSNIVNESLFWKDRSVLLFIICDVIFDWYLNNLTYWADSKAHEIHHSSYFYC